MNIPMYMLAIDDRPREKLITQGREVLSNSELLAIVIGSGNKKYSALQIAQNILNTVDQRFSNLAKMSIEELVDVEGIGIAKATTINAVLEIAKRRLNEEHVEKKVVRSSSDVYQYLFERFMDIEHEEFHVMYLNRANEVLKVEQLSKGGSSGTIADGKIIFKNALLCKASGLILTHNHPSGQRKPSEADKKLTKSLCEFGKMIDLNVLDHLIFCENTYFSFADEGLL